MSEKPPSPPYKKRRGRLFPQTAQQIIEPLLVPLVKKRGFGEVRILTQWADIVGTRLATQSRPISIQGQANSRTLLVAVNPAFATEMHYQQPQIIERIATYCGARIISKITFLQQPVAVLTPSATAPAPTIPGLTSLPPLPSANKAQNPAQTVDESMDPLDRALASLAKALQDGKQLT